MILWLDHKIFGNGKGMKSPFFDDRFYWLVDTYRLGRSRRAHGELYTFMSGLGAQLHSYQWTHPLAGETRQLIGREFRPLHSRRKHGRVEIAWAMTMLPRDLDGRHAAIRALQDDLNSVSMEPFREPSDV